MEHIAEELCRVVDAAALKLHTFGEAAVRVKPAPDAWSVQEILGHLIDSAVNNHHRFIRAQAADALHFPGYDQNAWVSTQAYNESPWPELVDLWRLYNRHLARVLRHVPAEKLPTEVRIGSGTPVTLHYLIGDYLVHLKHHLHQIEKRMASQAG